MKSTSSILPSTIIEVGSASCRLVVRSETNLAIQDIKFSSETNDLLSTLRESLEMACRIATLPISVVISSGVLTDYDTDIRAVAASYGVPSVRRLTGREEAQLGVQAAQTTLQLSYPSLVVDLGSSAQLTIVRDATGLNNLVTVEAKMGFNTIQKQVEVVNLEDEVVASTRLMWDKVASDIALSEVVAVGSMPLFMLLILGRYDGNPLKNTGEPLAITGQKLRISDLDDVITKLSQDLSDVDFIVRTPDGESISLSRKMNLAYAYQLKQLLVLAGVESAVLCTYEWRHVV